MMPAATAAQSWRLHDQARGPGVSASSASKVERDYFDSHVMIESGYRPLLVEGLQQARDTRVPLVSIHNTQVFRSAPWVAEKRTSGVFFERATWNEGRG